MVLTSARGKWFGAAAIVVMAGLFVWVTGSGPQGQAGAAVGASKAPEIQAPPPREKPSEIHVPILVYHNVRDTEGAKKPGLRPYDVTPAEFEAQMAYLDERDFASVSFADVAAALDGTRPLPPKPVLITIDDGRATQYDNAYPALLKHGLTATFFVFTNAMNRDGYLTWEQLAELRGKGMDVQSHTVYHPYLTKSTDEELKTELERSRTVIGERLGEPASVVAYPFGLRDERVDAAVRAAGYAMARGLRHVTVIKPADLLDLPGYIVTGDLKAFAGIMGE